MQIARHPIGAAQVDFRLAAVLEVKDAAVLEEPAHNTAHADAVADAANPRPQRADAAHEQFNVHSCLRSPVESLDNIFVDQGVDLDDHARRTPFAGMLGLPLNQAHTLLGQIQRRHQQRPVAGVLRVGSQKTENIVNRAGNLRVGREQAEIGIDAGRGRVVVAGAQVSVLPGDAIGIAPHQQRKLAVRLQAHQPVEDLHPGIFQIARPANVRRFIETRFQFHDSGDFLVGRGRHQSRNNRRMLARPVKRLLDGKHALVFRGRLNER